MSTTASLKPLFTKIIFDWLVTFAVPPTNHVTGSLIVHVVAAVHLLARV